MTRPGDRVEARVRPSARPPRPTWLRAAAVLGALAVALGVVRLVSTVGDDDATAGSAAASYTTTLTPPTRTLPPWPISTDACDGEVSLPVLTGQALQEPVGLRLLVGGQPRVVDLDSGAATALPGVSLSPGQHVTRVVSLGAASYLLVQSCTDGATGSVVRSDAGAAATVSNGPVSALISGDWVAGISYTENGQGATVTVLDPLDGGPQVALPPGFDPTGTFSHWVVGVQYGETESGVVRPGFVAFVDRTTGERDPAAAAYRVNVGATYGVVLQGHRLFSAGTECALGGVCTIFRYDLATGERRFFSVSSVPDGFSLAAGATVSPDGNRLAYVRSVSASASPYAADHPGPPQQVVVLDLPSGTTSTVDGVVLAPKASTSMVFGADGTELVVAAYEGPDTVLMVWRSGFAQRSRWTVAGQLMYGPSIDLAPSG